MEDEDKLNFLDIEDDDARAAAVESIKMSQHWDDQHDGSKEDNKEIEDNFD